MNVVENSHHIFVWVVFPEDNGFNRTTILLKKDPPIADKFWQIWRSHKHGMLYLKDEDEPFVDLECPIHELYNKEFVFRPWSPQYEHLRAHVEALPMDGWFSSPFLPKSFE